MKGICRLPLIPCRAEPSDRAEMVNQLLFGEEYTVLAEEEKWIQIKTDLDNYVAWIAKNQFSESLELLARKWVVNDLMLKASSDKAHYFLPAGSIISSNESIAIDNAIFNLEREISLPEKTDSFELAFSFLNTPYLWGGKSFLGIDCSGFIQVLFRACGINLQRDAYQQAEETQVIAFDERAKGDLAFFSNDNGKITHVGLLLGENKIIHASGKVRIDIFDAEGIIHSGSNSRTHQLFSLNRYFQ